LSERILPIEEVLTLLTEGPSRIVALTAGLGPARLHTRPSLDEWSANEVLAHLRSCADVWGGYIATIIAEENPTIRAVNPRTWIKSTDYLEQGFHISLHAFTGQRADLLAVLESLTPESWTRAATVTGAGKPYVKSLHSYAQWMATHERPHIKQINRIVTAMHK
jgi:hypothetical protein